MTSDLPEIVDILATHLASLQIDDAEIAADRVYTWLFAGSLAAGSTLVELPVHPTTEVREQLDVWGSRVGRRRFPTVHLHDPSPVDGGRAMRGFVGPHSVSVPAGDYLVDERSRVEIHRRRLAPAVDALALGAQSRVVPADFTVLAAGRLYLNLPIDLDLRFHQTLIERLDDIDAPWELKWYLPTEAATRRDATVVYFGLDTWRAVTGLVASTLADLEPPIRVSRPALTLGLAPGVGFAVSTQHGNGSFGHELSRLLIRGLRQVRADADRRQVTAAVEAELRAAGRDPASPWAPSKVVDGFALRDLPEWFATRSKSSGRRSDLILRAWGRGGPLAGSPPLLSALVNGDPESAATETWEAARDLYCGAAGWRIGLRRIGSSDLDALAPPASAPWRHGYLGGSVGELSAWPELAVVLDDRDPGPESDLSSGAAGTIAGLVELTRARPAAAGPALDAATVLGRRLLARREELRDGPRPGMAHGLLGVGWALLALAHSIDDAAMRTAARELIRGARWVARDMTAWCRGALIATLVATISGDSPRTAGDLLQRIASSRPGMRRDGTLCHGLAGLREQVSIATAMGVPVPRALEEELDEALYEGRNFVVADTQSAGLFDGPLGVAYALAPEAIALQGSVLLPGWRP